MAQLPCIGLYKPCIYLPFGDGDRHVQTDHGVFTPYTLEVLTKLKHPERP